MYGCESWTVKKAEYRRTDAFALKVDSLTDRISHCTLRCIFEKYGPIGDVYKMGFFSLFQPTPWEAEERSQRTQQGDAVEFV